MPSRKTHFFTIFARPIWVFIIGAPAAAIGFAFLIRDNLLSPGWREKLTILSFLPRWPWQIWIIVALILVIATIFECSFRYSRYLNERIESLDSKLRPNIKLSFHPTDEGVTREPVALHQAGQILAYGDAFYIRIRVETVSSIAVKGCRAFLTHLYKEKLDGLGTESIHLPHSIPLKAKESFTVDPGTKCTVDFAMAWSFNNTLTVPHAELPFSLSEAFNETGTYRFTIRVNNDDGVGAEITIAVVWPGRWDKVNAHEVRKT